jgi:hypothetical protein
MPRSLPTNHRECIIIIIFTYRQFQVTCVFLSFLLIKTTSVSMTTIIEFFEFNRFGFRPPPVLDMPATFNLELIPGQHVALDTTVSSDELDMARMEDGTMVDGMFWGKLDIVHSGDTHKMEFSGTRLNNHEYSPDFMFDSRVMTKLAVAAKPTTAKCHLSILAPAIQYCDVFLTPSTYWRLGMTWPPAENVGENKVKYFLRVHPGGALEHFESTVVTTALYYEAMYGNSTSFVYSFDNAFFPRRPDPIMVDPNDYVAPRNGFAMSLRDFIPHLMNVLDQLGMSIHARTNFIKYDIVILYSNTI